MTRPAHEPRDRPGLAGDEEGASLVFAAITLFALTTAIMFVYQVGMVSADRMQIQGAADAAAYSAAQVEANALNAIGQLNDGMAYLNYSLLRHTVDTVVYGTMREFGRKNPQPLGRHSWVLMGGDREASLPGGGGGQSGYEGWLRWEHTYRRLRETLPRGKQWVADLHHAGRMVLAATPKLVRDAACRIAALNGATHVAVSADLDLAFRVAGGGASSSGAFLEAQGTGGPFHESLYERYGRRRFPEVEDVSGGSARGKLADAARGLPERDWWSSAQGGLAGEYTQTRLCWNKKDWDHRPGLTDHDQTPYNQFRRGPPNAHWHRQHGHMWIEEVQFPDGTTVALPFSDGHRGTSGDDPLGGHYEDDTELHDRAKGSGQPKHPMGVRVLNGDLAAKPNPDHHHEVPCHTCDPYLQPRGEWSEVRASSNTVAGDLRRFFQLRWDSGFVPRPLRVDPNLFRNGITVVAWRPGRGLGSLFPASEWGMISVATAQVGYQTDQGVKPLTRLGGDAAEFDGERVPAARQQGGDPNYRNLFFSADSSKGVRFGARLAPVGRELSWHPDLADGSGLKKLLGGEVTWYRVAEGQDPSAEVPAELSGGGFGKLAEFVSPDPAQGGLEAFWH